MDSVHLCGRVMGSGKPKRFNGIVYRLYYIYTFYKDKPATEIRILSTDTMQEGYFYDLYGVYSTTSRSRHDAYVVVSSFTQVDDGNANEYECDIEIGEIIYYAKDRCVTFNAHDANDTRIIITVMGKAVDYAFNKIPRGTRMNLKGSIMYGDKRHHEYSYEIIARYMRILDEPTVEDTE